MANAPSSGVTITIDDSAGTPRIVTPFTITIGALTINNRTQVSTGVGDTWEKKLANGLRGGDPIQVTGYVDNTALTGTFATMVPADADAVPGFTRTLSVLIMTGKTYSAEVIITKGTIENKIGLAEFKATFDPTGTITIG